MTICGHASKLNIKPIVNKLFQTKCLMGGAHLLQLVALFDLKMTMTRENQMR